MNEESKFIAAYIRTSTTDHFHLLGQIDAIMRSQIDEYTLNACKVMFYVDFGYSGQNSERPAFQSLLEDMNNGKVTEVLVVDMSRLSRDAAKYQEIIHIARENDIEIITVS